MFNFLDIILLQFFSGTKQEGDFVNFTYYLNDSSCEAAMESGNRFQVDKG